MANRKLIGVSIIGTVLLYIAFSAGQFYANFNKEQKVNKKKE